MWRCNLLIISLLSLPRWPNLETFKWWRYCTTNAGLWNSLNPGSTLYTVTDRNWIIPKDPSRCYRTLYQNTGILKQLDPAREFVIYKEFYSPEDNLHSGVFPFKVTGLFRHKNHWTKLQVKSPEYVMAYAANLKEKVKSIIS